VVRVSQINGHASWALLQFENVKYHEALFLGLLRVPLPFLGEGFANSHTTGTCPVLMQSPDGFAERQQTKLVLAKLRNLKRKV
jgi:hypothetical protein